MSHIERTTLEKLCCGELPLDEQMEVLEHMSSCDYCAAVFAEIAEEKALMRAPTNLKSSILKQAGELPVQLQAKQFVLSKRLQLMLYSLKIGVAAASAILMIFMANTDTMLFHRTATYADFTKITKVTDRFTESVNTFTDQFMNGEVFNND